MYKRPLRTFPSCPKLSAVIQQDDAKEIFFIYDFSACIHSLSDKVFWWFHVQNGPLRTFPDSSVGTF